MSKIELRLVIIFWAHRLISFKQMFFWYLLLESHLTTYHSNVYYIQLRSVAEVGMSTLPNFTRLKRTITKTISHYLFQLPDVLPIKKATRCPES